MRLALWSAGTSCKDPHLLILYTFRVWLTHCSFYEALLIPFEISAFTLVLSFWSDEITKPGPIAGIVAGVIICYA